MRHEAISHKELDEAIGDMQYKSFVIRMLAVKAELTEQEKDHRDISQEALAEIFGVDTRDLRTWTERYRAEGIEGLGARGG